MEGTRLTLADIEAAGPIGRPDGRGWSTCTCPICGKRGKLSLHVDTGKWRCWYEDLYGRIGQGSRERYIPPNVQPAKPETPWREIVQKSRLVPVRGSTGQRYLEGRGITLDTMEACGVRFSGSYYRRAAVMFDIHDCEGNLVAVQGRFLDKAEPKMISCGPKTLGCFSTPGALEGDFALAEAPINAMSLWQMTGIPAVAMCGEGHALWLPSAAKGKTVYLAFDHDLPKPKVVKGEIQRDDDGNVIMIPPKGDIYFARIKPIFERAGATVVEWKPPHPGDWNDELKLELGIK